METEKATICLLPPIQILDLKNLVLVFQKKKKVDRRTYFYRVLSNGTFDLSMDCFLYTTRKRGKESVV